MKTSNRVSTATQAESRVTAPAHRWFAALLLMFAVGTFASPAVHAQTEQFVSADFALKPAAIPVGDSFRLLFVTTQTTTATSAEIATYNTLVQTSAGGGHSAIQTFNSEFRALISTATVDANVNTATTGIGVPIYWLNGDKVADNYTDFYDGDWDSVTATDRSGGTFTFADTRFSNIWTGSASDGTKVSSSTLSPTTPIGTEGGVHRTGTLSENDEIEGFRATVSSPYPLYALSPILTVVPPPTFDATIPPQTYPTGTAISAPLPTASGGISPLSYTLGRIESGDVLPDGLSFDPAVPAISGMTTVPFGTTTAATLTYTVTDAASQTNALTFTVKTVTVTVADDGTVGYLDGAIAASNIGGDAGGNNNNDMRLLLPEGHSVTTVTVTTYNYDPSTTAALPDGDIFSGVAMDIALTPAALTFAADMPATVCLSTAEVPERRIPALYRYDTVASAWEETGPATHTIDGFICGTTTAFSPFAVGYGAPPVVTFDDTDPLVAQIYQVGQAVALTLPPAAAADNMGMLTYTLTPIDSIPDGLSFDPDSRTLGGIPTTETPRVTLTYTAIDDTTAMESLTFTVTVSTALAFDTSTIPAPDSAYTYLPRRAITPLTLPPASGGIDPLTYSLTPTDSIPAGLTFDSDARTLGGTPTTETPRVTLTYTATDANGMVVTATFTVTVESDTDTNTTTRLNEQILTRAVSAMTASTSAAVATRVESAADGIGGSGKPLAFQLDGRSSLPALLEKNGKAMLEESMDYERLLDGGASFVLPLQATDGATNDASTGTGKTSVWGSSDFRNLAADEGGLDWDGKTLSAHLGIDKQFSEQTLAGLALSWNDASFDYADDSTNSTNSTASQGEYQYSVVTINPYIGWSNDGLKLWGTVGFGQGEITIDQEDGDGGSEEPSTDTTDTDTMSTDTTQLSLAGGFNHRLTGSPGRSLHIKGDIALTQVAVEAEAGKFAEQDVASSRLRLLLSGERQRALASGGRLTPSLEVGIRNDGGDGTTGTGVELGGGLRYANPGGTVAVAGNIRTLLAGEYDESGADFSVRLSSKSGRGLSLTLHPVWAGPKALLISYGMTAPAK